jgi:hypothetical protein
MSPSLPNKKDVDVKGNVHNIKTNAVHATLHAMPSMQYCSDG